MSTLGSESVRPESSPSVPKANTRSYTACKRCHTQKVKCSGGNPCRNCKQAKNSPICVYPVRDRKVAVSESYLKELENEVKSLKRKRSLEESTSIPETSSLGPNSISALPPSEQASIVADSDVSNPLVDISGRFASDRVPVMAPYVGAAACTTFGTRLSHYVNGDDSLGLPLQRVRYFKHRELLRISSTDYQLPNKHYAKLLVRVVLRFIGHEYHILQRKTFVEQLEQTYANGADQDPIWLCRLFLVFALGELYSASSDIHRTSSVPGTGYFMRAMNLFQDLHEEATIPYIETVLLVSFYSHALNRRNSAYIFAGLALRLSMTLGLHRKVADVNPLSPIQREHRIRVWWTVYNIDRLCSAKLGYPIMLRDEDIDTELPSMNGLTLQEQEDFVDPTHLRANVELTRITGDIITNIYRIPREGQPNTFVQDVHKILTKLKLWLETLPQSLRLNQNTSPSYSARHVASLHLHFNQCVILTTRPILFYLFKTRFPPSPSQPRTRPLSPVTSALGEACIQAARASNSMLAQLWIDNNVAIYGYFDANYIFSSTITLMLSKMLRDDGGRDEDAVETACSLLRSMRDKGSFPATDYYEYLTQLRADLDRMREENEGKGKDVDVQKEPNPVNQPCADLMQPPMRPMDAQTMYSNAAGTGFDDPFIQDFLMQTDSQLNYDFGSFVDRSMFPWASGWEDSHI